MSNTAEIEERVKALELKTRKRADRSVDQSTKFKSAWISPEAWTYLNERRKVNYNRGRLESFADTLDRELGIKK